MEQEIPINPMDEVLDLVDSDDHVIGQARRSEIYRKQMKNFRVVNGFLENAAGQIWTLRRSPNAAIFPLGLDMSVGGHVKSGETYEDAFARELKEELSLDATLFDISLLGALTPQKDGVSAFTKVYKIACTVTPTFNPEEFVEGFWIYPSELLRRIKNGEFAKGDLRILIEKFWGGRSL